MLTRLYVEALLSDQDQADAIWEMGVVVLIPDEVAALMWAVRATRR